MRNWSMYKINFLSTIRKFFRIFSAKEGENIFKLEVGNESFHKTNNDNGIRSVKFVTTTTKILLLRVQYFHIGTFTNTLGLVLIGRHKLIM
jgi:hypothetical protein